MEHIFSVEGVVYHCSDQETYDNDVCFHQRCRKGVEGTGWGFHHPDDVLNLLKWNFWKGMKRPADPKLWVVSQDRLSGRAGEGKANCVNLCFEEGNDFVAVLICSFCEWGSLRFKDMIYRGKQLLGIARTVFDDIWIKLWPCFFKGLWVSLLVLLIG